MEPAIRTSFGAGLAHPVVYLKQRLPLGEKKLDDRIHPLQKRTVLQVRFNGRRELLVKSPIIGAVGVE
ncbi:MAG TPA: hypothetical protein VI546_00625, partial [candidate division Zixibacteria bacterium]|nr:hypothetical protein [candidate division Zixibacteria bacterium]